MKSSAIGRLVVVSLTLLTAFTAGCDGGPRDEVRRETVTTPASPGEMPLRVDLGPEAAVLYRRALVRDPAPSCAALTEGLSRPTAALLEVVERTTAPASAGMRAATCLVREHAAEIEPRMTQWVQHRETMGLGLLVLGHLDRFDAALAQRLAHAALDGEIADRARPRVLRWQRSAARTIAPSTGATAPQ